MTLYHGGSCVIENPYIITGKYSKDFGAGFYCTLFKEQAVRWAKRNENAVLNKYEYNENESLKILKFETMTEEWLDFIVNCRLNKTHDYDIVEGPMANDQIFNYIADFMNNILTREQFWVLSKFKHPTHQISFCTKNSLNNLKFIGSEVVK